MAYIEKKAWEQLIKQERNRLITPFDLAYKAFTDLEYHHQGSEYFSSNASEYIEAMRSKCWEEYVPFEREFTTKMLGSLINRDKISGMDPVSAIESFVEDYPEQIYVLALSNTQSRRSRAGKEFEAILELLLIGSDVPVDTQGSVGKQIFTSNGLGKLVDFVSPGVVQYAKTKRNTTLISAKTTLRERWQEVPEEVSRTGTREMYLATLDDAITQETLRVLYEANVIVATTKRNKELHYAEDTRVISFEELISIAKDAADKWTSSIDRYTTEEMALMEHSLQAQVDKHTEHPYVREYYTRRLARLQAYSSYTTQRNT